jgi:hypothetical protein
MLRFLQHDLNNLKQSEWVEVIQEVRGLAYLASTLTDEELAGRFISDGVEVVLDIMYWDPTPKMIRNLKVRLRTLINELVTQEGAEWKPGATRFWITPATQRTPQAPGRTGGFPAIIPPIFDAEAIIATCMLRFIQVLQVEPIARCPNQGLDQNCQGLYLKGRADQVRCRPECGGTIRVKEWRKKKRAKLTKKKPKPTQGGQRRGKQR